MKSKKYLKLILILALIFSGFGRDYLMVNINWIIKHLTLNAPNYAQQFFQPLIHWKVPNLMLLKWILTAVFTAYFYGLTYLLIQLVFVKKIYLKYVRNTYAIIIVISALIFVFGFLTNNSTQIYPAVRTLMGMAQSFIPFMVLYLLLKFSPKQA